MVVDVQVEEVDVVFGERVVARGDGKGINVVVTVLGGKADVC